MSMMDKLADKIGIRVGGTDAAAEAADTIASRFAELGIPTTRQSFTYEGYEVTRDWDLEIHSHDKELDVAPVLYSGDTGESGITGTLQPAGTRYIIEGLFELPQYAIVDDGEHQGYLVANPTGAAFPIPNTDMQFVEILGLVGGDAHDWIESTTGEGIEVTLTTGGKRVPGYTDDNVIGRIEGTESPDQELVVGAHYDSAYQTPGAADNAAGVEAMMRVAEKFADDPPDQTVVFVAFGAEEWWLLGSRQYVRRRKQESTLDAIQAMVNIDTLGRGDTIHVWAGDGDIKTVAGHAVEHVVDTEMPRNYQQVISGSDHWPFYQEDIPVAMLITWPYEDYHLPSDTVEKVDRDQIVEASQITTELIDTLDASPEFRDKY